MSLEQIARDIREGTFPKKSEATKREELLGRAEQYLNLNAAESGADVLIAELADALRASPLTSADCHDL